MKVDIKLLETTEQLDRLKQGRVDLVDAKTRED